MSRVAVASKIARSLFKRRLVDLFSLSFWDLRNRVCWRGWSVEVDLLMILSFQAELTTQTT